MLVVPFKSGHEKQIKLQPMQAFQSEVLKDWKDAPLFEKLDSYTIYNAEGTIVFIGGIMSIWNNRSLMWSFFAEEARKDMVAIVRIIADFITTHDTRRIECWADPDFPQANKMLLLLGFKFEGLMKRFYEDGRDCNLYALIRE